MANEEGWSTVTGQRPGSVDLSLDDGRIFKGVHLCGIGHEYKGHCNPRFVTAEAYHSYKETVRPTIGGTRVTATWSRELMRYVWVEAS
jgi:hypothetical protein